MFKLDERLDKDTFFISDLPLCRVLLMNDNQFPWLILVPRVADVAEIIDLDELVNDEAFDEELDELEDSEMVIDETNS